MDKLANRGLRRIHNPHFFLSTQVYPSLPSHCDSIHSKRIQMLSIHSKLVLSEFTTWWDSGQIHWMTTANMSLLQERALAATATATAAPPQLHIHTQKQHIIPNNPTSCVCVMQFAILGTGELQNRYFVSILRFSELGREGFKSCSCLVYFLVMKLQRLLQIGMLVLHQ